MMTPESSELEPLPQHAKELFYNIVILKHQIFLKTSIFIKVSLYCHQTSDKIMRSLLYLNHSSF